MDLKEQIEKDGSVISDNEKIEIFSIESKIIDDLDKPIFIARKGEEMAEGKTERIAMLSLKKKIFRKTSVEERINNFINKYSPNELHTADEWIQIHQELTGSCYIGARRFLKNNNIKRFAKYTTLEFLDIVEEAYDSDIIATIKNKYKGGN